jgi:hypothetical protein
VLDVTASTNHPPVIHSVIASPSEVRVGENIALAASVSDSDHLPLTFEWKVGAISLPPLASVEATAVAPGQPGPLEIQLTVRDAAGAAATAVTVATVVPANGGCSRDSDCSDGIFCNGAELCSSGQCQQGTPPHQDTASFPPGRCYVWACTGGEVVKNNSGAGTSCGDACVCDGTGGEVTSTP